MSKSQVPVPVRATLPDSAPSLQDTPLNSPYALTDEPPLVVAPNAISLLPLNH